MKLKLSILAASVALAFTGNASAGIATGASGNGELFLGAWFTGGDGEPGTADDRTYVRDLGNGQGGAADTQFGLGTYDVNDFVGTANPPALNPTYTTGSAAPILTFDPDAAWGAFTNGLSAGQLGSIQYAVLAADTTGSGAGNRRYLMTVNGDAPAVTNTPLTNIWDGTINTFLSNTNGIPEQGALLTPESSSVFVGPGAANAAQAFGANLGAGSPGIAGSIGSQLDFWLYNNSSASGNAAARQVQFLNAAIPSFEAYWQLQENGTLIYAVPVPEPGTWAMLAAGLFAVGAIARRRVSA